MPLYEFECETCNEMVEILLRSREEKATCPDCGGTKLTRLMSATAAPSTNAGKDSLPMAGNGESCGMPRCCGGVCR